jgi:hypothetical protein
MDKENVSEPYNGLLFEHKKNKKLIKFKLWMSLEKVIQKKRI